MNVKLDSRIFPDSKKNDKKIFKLNKMIKLNSSKKTVRIKLRRKGYQVIS